MGKVHLDRCLSLNRVELRICEDAGFTGTRELREKVTYTMGYYLMFERHSNSRSNRFSSVTDNRKPGLLCYSRKQKRPQGLPWSNAFPWVQVVSTLGR